MMNKKYDSIHGIDFYAEKPVVVDKRKGHFHFPVLYGRKKEDFVLIGRISHDPPEGIYFDSELYTTDESGASWNQTGIVLPNLCSSSIDIQDDTLVMPFYFMELNGCRRDLIGSTYLLERTGGALKPIAKNVEIKGFPDEFADSRWNRDEDHAMVCACTDGNVISINHEAQYMGLMYGVRKQDEGRTDRKYSLYVIHANQDNPYEWTYLSKVAGPSDVSGREGPCEASLVRLDDGRILCVFRVGCFSVGSGSNPSMDCYYKSYSQDEGKTWSLAEPFHGVWAVEPRLLKMSNGTIILCGGRPGIYMWVCTDGIGEQWHRINILEIHNELIGDKALQIIENYQKMDAEISTDSYQTTSYTDIKEGEPGVLYITYDRIPYGWKIVPEEDPEFQTIFVLKIGISS